MKSRFNKPATTVITADDFLQLLADRAGMTAGELSDTRLSAAMKSRYLSVGLAIAEARKAKNITQAELAAMAGTTQPELSRLEQGKLNATLDTILGVTSVLDLAIELRPIKSGRVTSQR